MPPLLFIFTVTALIFTLCTSFHQSPYVSNSIHISPSLLPSPLLSSHELISYLRPLSPHSYAACTKTHPYKSSSHILFLSMLLLLASGDISPNPGPCLISTCSRPRLPIATSTPSGVNPSNLIPIPCHPPSSLQFSCALWNARSLSNKFLSVHDFFLSHSLLLFAITETWLTQSDSALEAALSYGGLSFSHTPPLMAGVEAWGSCSPLSAATEPFLFLPLAFPSFEVHTVQIFSPLPVHVAVIYRPPSSTHPPSAFLSHFESWLTFFLSSDSPVLLLGDFNCHIDDPSLPWASRFLSLTSSIGLQQWTAASTHKDGHYLDLVFTKLLSLRFLHFPFSSL
ncbi:hypothetical protein FKM82_027590 [Ascaphus truei]